MINTFADVAHHYIGITGAIRQEDGILDTDILELIGVVKGEPFYVKDIYGLRYQLKKEQRFVPMLRRMDFMQQATMIKVLKRMSFNDHSKSTFQFDMSYPKRTKLRAFLSESEWEELVWCDHNYFEYTVFRERHIDSEPNRYRLIDCHFYALSILLEDGYDIFELIKKREAIENRTILKP